MTMPVSAQGAIDWSRYMEGLQGKANIDLNNLSPTGKNNLGMSRVIEQKINSDGSFYRKYSNGWLEQGGRITINKSTAYFKVNLLKPMKDKNYRVSLTEIRINADTGNDYAAVCDYTNSTPTLISIRGDNNTTYLDWEVKGQGA